jgi:hypothetical protein
MVWRDLISGRYVGWRLGKIHIKISKRSAALEKLNGRDDINMAWGKQRKYQNQLKTF